MLHTPCSEVVWRVLANHSIRQYPLYLPSRASPCAITFQLESTRAIEKCQVHYNCCRELDGVLFQENPGTNIRLKTALFCVITQGVVVIYYRRFGTTYPSYLQCSRIQRFSPIFIFVPCMLFQSLLYCSNSCTSLQFKILKSHTKTLKIRPYMFRSPLKPSSGDPWPYIPWHSPDQIGTHTHTDTHTQTEWIDIQPHTDTLYNKCKSTFQFSNLSKYGHGQPEDSFKGDRNM